MTQHWALLVGINNYQHLQPLLYAQRDAQTLHRFLIEAGEIAADRCILLSDFSPAINDISTYPSQTTIRDWIGRVLGAVQADYVVWLYLCGYGVRSQGQDYFMPIDGDPNRLPQSAIALSDVIDQLQQLPTAHRLLVLDINRSQGQLDEIPVGQQTLELADQQQVATILSCQPGQFSHETIMLRAGLFTHALLESLRQSQPPTLDNVTNYLSARLPELSQHHWRPVQEPVTVIPTHTQKMALLPSAVPIMVGAGATAGGSTSRPAFPNGANGGIPTVPPNPIAPNSPPPQSSALVTIESTTEPTSTSLSDGLWKQLLLWGGVALIIAVLMIARNFPIFSDPESEPDADIVEPITPVGDGEPSQATGEGTDQSPAPTEDTTAIPPSDPSATNGDAAGNTAEDTAETDQSNPGAETGETEAGESETGGLRSLTNLFNRGENDNVRPNQAIENAQAAAGEGRYQDALNWLDQVPESRRDEAYTVLRQSVAAQLESATRANQALLNAAKAPIRLNQASTFNQAIEAARRIPPNQPLYDEAQQSIQRWSQVILDLAEGRAAQGNLNAAIAAAELVPPDQAEIYRQAQARISQWQIQKDAQARIAEAKALIQPGQANTYQKAIRWLQPIRPEQPEYSQAQPLISQWSRDMLAIARARAAQGQFASAIQAAQLVPANTVAYDQAQQEIQRWREQS
ncbi:MAG: caspase family protein [Thainema sp.]